MDIWQSHPVCRMRRCLVLVAVTLAHATWLDRAPAEPFRVVHAFADGSGAAAPFSSVILHDGWLFGTANYTSNESTSTVNWGTTTPGGAIFAVRPDGTDFRVLKAFTPSGTSALDGYGPFQGLTVAGDRLVGTNLSGGANGKGTLYSVAIDGSDYKVLQPFGATGDGATPYASPVLVGTTLYGMTFAGGVGGGTIYSYDVISKEYTVRHMFAGTGLAPLGTLTPVGNWLYGMVSDHRNRSAYGQIFRFRPADNFYEVLHVFAGGTAGGYPYDTLTWDGDPTGYVYGTTLGFYSFTPPGPEDIAGLNDEGVIFRLNLATNHYEVIHDFSLAAGDGGKPNSSMLIGPDGFLYGIAHGSQSFGGTEWGTLYRLAPDGSGFTVLHTFDSMENGMVPMRALVWDDGVLYGTAVFGGVGAGVGNGMVWSYTVVPEPAALVLGLCGVGALAVKALRLLGR